MEDSSVAELNPWRRWHYPGHDSGMNDIKFSTPVETHHL